MLLKCQHVLLGQKTIENETKREWNSNARSAKRDMYRILVVNIEKKKRLFDKRWNKWKYIIKMGIEATLFKDVHSKYSWARSWLKLLEDSLSVMIRCYCMLPREGYPCWRGRGVFGPLNHGVQEELPHESINERTQKNTKAGHSCNSTTSDCGYANGSRIRGWGPWS
jgi:hypothetical protein